MADYSKTSVGKYKYNSQVRSSCKTQPKKSMKIAVVKLNSIISFPE